MGPEGSYYKNISNFIHILSLLILLILVHPLIDLKNIIASD
jgi:hypothetical protein